MTYPNFQTQNVGMQYAFGVPGDFASNNPRATVLPAPGSAGWQAGPGGLITGNFAFAGTDDATATSYGRFPGAPLGFIGNDKSATLQGMLQGAGMNIPQGYPVALFKMGDFMALNAGTSTSTAGGAIYASYADGSVWPLGAPTGASVTGAMGATCTASIGSTCTASLGATCTGTANVGDDASIDITAVTGYITVGEVISGTGIPSGTTIVSLTSGTPGGAGTYRLSAVNIASSATCTTFGTTVNITVRTGLVSLQDVIVGGAGFPTGATIVSQTSGSAGNTGRYVISAPGTAYAASASGVTTYGNVLNVTARTNLISIAETVSGGTGFPVGATITAQLTGSAGNTGTYQMSAPATAYVASASGVTTFGDVLNVTTIGSGVIAVGEAITGSNIPSNATIASFISGANGGIGVYTVAPSATAYAASTTVTVVAGVLTKWVSTNVAASGELVFISRIDA